MAYYDRAAAARKKAQADKYEELKKFICNNDAGKVSEWYLAYEHIMDMELEFQKKEVQIKEYQHFFALLRKLLPRNFSIHDTIG